jgi:hypothetical protein
VLFSQYYEGDHVEEGEMGLRAGGMHERDMCKCLVDKYEGKRPREILKGKNIQRILKK